MSGPDASAAQRKRWAAQITVALADDARTAFLNETLRAEIAAAAVDGWRLAQNATGAAPGLPRPLSRLAHAEVDAALDALGSVLGADLSKAALARLRRLNRRRHTDHQVTELSDSPGVFFTLPTLPESLAVQLRGATALLRVRAHRRVGGHAIFAAKAETWAETQRIDSAPDELLVATHAPLKDGVRHLVAVAQAAFARIEPSDDDALSAAVVATGAHPDDPELDAVFAAAARLKLPGRITVDKLCAAATPDLLTAEGPFLSVSPRTPYAQDRYVLSRALPPVAFVGRERDVEQMKTHLLASTNKPRLLLLSGAEGVGKTTVLREVLARAGYADAAAPVMWGGAGAKGQSPLSPFISMIRALSGATPERADARNALRHFVRSLAPYLPPPLDAELLRHEVTLAQLIGAQDAETITVAVEDDGRIADLSPRALRAAIFRAIHLLAGALAARAGHRPVVMVITNAHDLSTAARTLLSFLAEKLGGDLSLVLVSQRRPRLKKAFTGAFVEKARTLRGLSHTAMNSLMAALGFAGSDADRKALNKGAAGSPLALLQMVRLGLESGVLRRQNARVLSEGIKSRDFPKRVETMVQRRAAVLPESVKALLLHCAALGPTFSLRAAHFIGARLQQKPATTEAALLGLTETGYLVRMGPRPGAPAFEQEAASAGEMRFAFQHPAVRRGLWACLDDQGRADALGLAADVYEALFVAARPAMPARLAGLHEAAGHNAKAADLFGAASRRALRLFDPAAAEALAKKALTLVSPDDAARRVQLLLRHESALDARGQHDAQDRVLEALAEGARESGDAALIQQVHYRTARYALQFRDEQRADAALVALMQQHPTPTPRRGRALRLLGMRRLMQRDGTGALDALTEAGAPGNVARDADRAALAFQHGLVLSELERPAAALEQLLLARFYRRRCADPAGEAACLDRVADLLWRLGRPQSAAEVLTGAVLVRSKVGDGEGEAQSHRDLARVYLALGDTDAALVAAEKSIALAKAGKHSDIELSSGVVHARALLQKGQHDDADRIVNNLARRAARAGRSVRMEIALFGAEVKLARAAHATTPKARETLATGALARAQKAGALSATIGSVWGEVLSRAFRGRALHTLGRPLDALPYTQHALELVDERAFTALPIETVMLAHADVLDAMGDPDEADVVIQSLYERLETVAQCISPERLGQYWSVFSRAEVRARALGESTQGPDASAHAA